MEILGFALVAVVIIAAVVFFGFRRVVQHIVIAREQRRATAAEVEQWDRKLALLENKNVVEFFAPSSEFVKDWDPDKKKPKPAAWASPYRAAVLKLWSKRKSESPNKLALVRQQIASVADQIFIETLPDEEQPANAGTEHFSVVLPLHGRPAPEVEGLSETIKSVLKLNRADWSLSVSQAREPGTVRFVGHAVEPTNRLVAQKNGSEWFTSHPLANPYICAIGVDSFGRVVKMRMHHTFGLGATGTGKGSIIGALLWQYAELIDQGLVEVYAIDPNDAELEKFKNSRLLKAYASTQHDGEALCKYVFALMNERSKALVRNEENGHGQKHIISRENPLVLFIIDELSAFQDDMKPVSRNQENEAKLALNGIWQKGLKRGFFIIGLAQNARFDTVGAALRANTSNWFLFRIASADAPFNDLFLGKDAAARGFDATQINPGPVPEGTEEDEIDLLTAGIGFYRAGSREPKEVRFAYVDGNALHKLAEKYALPEGQAVPALPTMTGKQRAAFENLSVELGSSPEDEGSTVEQPLPETPAPTTDVRKAFFEADGLAPIQQGTPQRSQVDELAEVREWPQENLLKARERFASRLAQKDSIKGRAWLDAIEAQIRLNDRMAVFAKPADDDETETALPSIY